MKTQIVEKSADTPESATIAKAVLMQQSDHQGQGDSLVMSAPETPDGLSAALLLSSSLHLSLIRSRSPSPCAASSCASCPNCSSIRIR